MKHTRQEVVRFHKIVLDYYQKHRRDLPWRPPTLPLRKDGTADPYAILVSEVMLQQTQVERVTLKFLEWMRKFPTPESLAKASLGDVLKLWQGLGYNRRALNLKRAAEMIVKEYGGEVPRDIEKIDALPGVGPYTAGAIAAFAFDIPSAFIETNIRTVYLHFFFKGKREVRDEEILEAVGKTLPRKNIRDWYYALMDYGVMLKHTVGNQNARSSEYAKQSAFKGSRREVRGEILRKATERRTVSPREIAASGGHGVQDIFAELVREGFLKRKGRRFIIA